MHHRKFSTAVKIASFSIMLLSAQGLAQSVYFKRIYGSGPASKIAREIKPSADGNLIIAGEVWNPTTKLTGFYFLKLNPNGDSICDKQYQINFSNHIYAMAPTSDGGFMVAAQTMSSKLDGQRITLLKINAQCDTTWTKTFAADSNEYPEDIVNCPNGEFLIIGTTTFNNYQSRNHFLIKINNNGDTLWRKPFTHRANQGDHRIRPAGDGNYMICCDVWIRPNHYVIFLQKISPDGNLLWSKLLERDQEFHVLDIAPTADEGFLLPGYSAASGSATTSLSLVKTDFKGDTLWSRIYPETGVFHRIQPSFDGNYIVSGFTDAGLIVMKITPDGTTLWSKSITEATSTRAICHFSGGNYLIPGYMGEGKGIFLASFVDDQFASKSNSFTYKIPVSSDSLNYSYKIVNAPIGMTISQGGSISWTPATDSTYKEQVKCVVSNDVNVINSFDVNVFVNDLSRKNLPTPINKKQLLPNYPVAIVATIFQDKVAFYVPGNTETLDIYDLHGRSVQHLPVYRHCATWVCNQRAGNYIARTLDGKLYVSKIFTVAH